MKFSSNWLKEVINQQIDNKKLTEQLTMAGLEVESVEPACINFSKVYAAEIVNVEPHPNADKLKVCSVKYDNNLLQIVCGDPKVSAGFKVALATVGASLQNGDFKIKKSKLRGVESHGMLCSKAELGLADASDGIWVLPEEVPLDVDLSEYLQLDDEVIELSLTPNRGDCFSVRGVARETAVLNSIDVDLDKNLQDITKQKYTKTTDKLNINLLSEENCPKYTGRIIKNLNNKAVTPLWMQERLRRSGMRSVYPLVDVTNFVMLELGQPMHAFDLTQIDHEINIRTANVKNQEKLVLLDGKEIVLTDQDLVIADKTKPLALAGIMGGEHSGISENTTDVLLESAYFNPVAIARSARLYNIVTDSSQRFERGVDPSITKLAIERATDLLLQIAGTDNTQVSDLLESQSSDSSILADNKIIELRHARIKRVLGIELAEPEVKSILVKLGLKLIEVVKKDSNNIYKWSVPSHRFDLNIEEDLIEEVARIYGYNNIPNNAPKRPLELKASQPEVELKNNIRNILTNRGYSEVITYSFIDSKLQKDYINGQTTELYRAVKLINPISSEMGELRMSLIPGLIKVADYNLKHQTESLKIYEIGKSFYLSEDSKNGEVIETMRLAGLITGYKNNSNWHTKDIKVDFYDAKGDLEILLNKLTNHSAQKITFETIDEHNIVPGVHPSQSAVVKLGGQSIGWIGSIHPQVIKKTKIDNSVILFELNLDEIKNQGYTEYKEVSKMPLIRRDLAFIFKNEIKFQQLYDIVSNIVGDLLKDLFVFDIYTGEGIPEGCKSLAFAMLIQHNEKTLVDAEINSIVDKVVDNVTKQLKGRLRE